MIEKSELKHCYMYVVMRKDGLFFEAFQQWTIYLNRAYVSYDTEHLKRYIIENVKMTAGYSCSLISVREMEFIMEYKFT